MNVSFYLSDSQDLPPSDDNAAPLRATEKHNTTSSLLIKASGRTVFISDEARKRSSSVFSRIIGQAPSSSSVVRVTPVSTSASSAKVQHLDAPSNEENLFPKCVGDKSEGGQVSSLPRKAKGSTARICATTQIKAEQFLNNSIRDTHARDLETPTHEHPPLTRPGIGRISSLLTTARGGKVAISDTARRRATEILQSVDDSSSPSVSFETPLIVMNSARRDTNSSIVRTSTPDHARYSISLSDENCMTSSTPLHGLRFEEKIYTHSPSSNVNPFIPSYLIQQSFTSSCNQSSHISSDICIYDTFSQLCDSINPTSQSQQEDSRKLVTVNSTIVEGRCQVPCIDTNALNNLENSSGTGFRSGSNSVDNCCDIRSMFTCKITPCITFKSLLEDDILPDEMATWKEIINTECSTSKDLLAVTSTRVLSEAQFTYGNIIYYDTMKSEYKDFLVCKMSDMNVDIPFSASLKDVLYRALNEFPTLSQYWVLMQLNWIIWTLISYQRRFLELYPESICTKLNIEKCLRSRIELYCFQKIRTEREGFAKRCTSVRPSLEHFKKSGAMSPLQRCCDILCFVWPMCVCVSIPTKTSKFEGGVTLIQITDGWFWALATVDKGVERLIREEKLRDGYKVAIFSAPIVSGEASKASSVVKIQLNCLRLASNNAPLGFIHPRSLSRCLSIKSLTLDGGPVFGVRFEVIRISSPYSRVNLVDQDGELIIDGFTITLSELNWLKTRIDDIEEKELTRLMELEESQGKRRKIEPEDNCSFSSAFHFRNILNVSLLSLLLVVHYMSYSFTQLNLISSQDILIKCALSGSLAWIKIPFDGEDQGSSENMLRFSTGRKYILTNLKPCRSIGSTFALTISNHSSLTCLTTPTEAKDRESSLDSGRSRSEINSLVLSNRILQFSSLSELLRCKSMLGTIKSFCIGGEISAKLIIVDWWLEERPISYSASSLDTDWCSIMSIRILCIDDSNYSVEISFSTFKKYVEKLPWLKKNREIFAENLLVREVDPLYQVARVLKTDRCTITLIKQSNIAGSTNLQIANPIGPNDPLSQLQSQPSGNLVNAKKKTKNAVVPRPNLKRSIGNSQQTSLLAFASPNIGLSTRLQLLCEEERVRFAAIRGGNQLFYESQRIAGVKLSTGRTMCYGVLEKYPAVDVSGRFPEWRMVIVHMELDIVVALCESTDVEKMIPEADGVEIVQPLTGVITIQEMNEGIVMFSSAAKRSIVITHVVLSVSPDSPNHINE